MNNAPVVRTGSAESRGPEVFRPREYSECGSRAADMSADLYARSERARRRESLEELLSRGRQV